MSKLQIVIADTDEKYLATLEYKLIKELGDKVELELISDPAYFETYFSSPKTAEIVAVCEKLYNRDLQKHNINHLFVLTEEEENGNTEELSVHHIYKYTGIKEIYNELIYRSIDKIDMDAATNQETCIIALHSAIGGCGKTALGLGLANSLSENHRKVLYINTESIQEFGYYLKDKSMFAQDGIRAVKNDLGHIYPNIRHLLHRESFTYLPPLQVTLDAANLNYSIYRNMIQTAKDSREYDFIVVDIEAGYSENKMELLQMADKVLMVCLQDKVSVQKMEYLLRNIDLRDREKYLFICNKYDETKQNAYLESEMQARFTMSEYVERLNGELTEVRQVSALKGIQKLAYMFI